MTFRITFGIDPGQTGAIAVLADGVPVTLLDMPAVPRATGGQKISSAILAALLRGQLQAHQGAHVLAVVEEVHATRQMGSTSAFNFGRSDGQIDGVLGALGIGLILANPVTWKKHFRIHRGKDDREQIGQSAYKDLSRTLAIQRFPSLAMELSRKKDAGRADALLIALWAHETEQASLQAAA